MGLFDLLFKPAKAPIEKTSGKNPQMFDARKEYELLQEYKKYKGNRNSREYFSALPMINFYYKFRNLDEKYLNCCIYYCNVCIACLDSRDMKRDIADGISIPAFKRLIIIFENKNEYEKALELTQTALKYTSRENAEDAKYYLKKAETIKKKLENV